MLGGHNYEFRAAVILQVPPVHVRLHILCQPPTLRAVSVDSYTRLSPFPMQQLYSSLNCIRFRFRLILLCQHTTFSNSNVYTNNEIIKYADMEAPILNTSILNTYINYICKRNAHSYTGGIITSLSQIIYVFQFG